MGNRLRHEHPSGPPYCDIKMAIQSSGDVPAIVKPNPTPLRAVGRDRRCRTGEAVVPAPAVGRVIDDGLLSDAQIESVIYPGGTHSGHHAGGWTVDETCDIVSAAAEGAENPVRFRRGWFLGDGTGCGKGRKISGIILDNWLQGRRRAIWFSKSEQAPGGGGRYRDPDRPGPARACQAQQHRFLRETTCLPVGYFHVVFTLPAEVADIAFYNRPAIYDLLFKAASETMLTIAADPKHFGARIGVTAVLHTRDDAPSACAHDRPRWRHRTGRATLDIFQAGLPAPSEACPEQALGGLRQDAVRRPRGSTAYLSRYTHRVAISNGRLITFDESGVAFRSKDYRCSGADRQQVITLATDKFIRRLLLHAYPRGFPSHPPTACSLAVPERRTWRLLANR